MALQKSPVTPYWDRVQNERRDRSPESKNDLAKAIKGLWKQFKDPNQPDKSNPVRYGAATESNRRSRVKDFAAGVVSQSTRVGLDLQLLGSELQTWLADGGVVNDKEYQMEQLIDFAQSLPSKSDLKQLLDGEIIKTLWNNLQHPPLSFQGPEYRYRKADGSNNNVMYPQLGMAGSDYARTVTPKTFKPGVLPDPGLIFDSLFARRKDPEPHPSKLSSMFFYLATIIIHDVFNTDPRDKNKVKTSSYLDLAPLYGSSTEEQASIRSFQDGMLKPDTFAESRVLGFPPGVAALLVCFNRYHNYIAINLKEINENGRFDQPHPDDEHGLRRLDEDLFQTARLVTCGLYVNIVLYDYVRTILNLDCTESSYTLDPRNNCSDYFDAHGAPQGIGNQVSVEFNLLYRWHSAVSVRDAAWTERAYKQIFGEVDTHSLTEQEFSYGLYRWAQKQDKDPSQWTMDFGTYQRNERGTFLDHDLVQILTDATDDVACAFGPNQVPLAMRTIEIMGIKQARQWNVATLNEFRQYFKLKPYNDFSEISKDPEVACALKALYKKPDYVELYPGIVVEDAKARRAGSGLCPGFTISRTILADAVALVRGDRFYTIDFSPANLTNWGFNQILSDQSVAGGQVIYNLIMRAMPNWYRRNSVYAMFPFVHPSETLRRLEENGQGGQYTDDKPNFIPVPPAIQSWADVRNALRMPQRLRVPWGKNTEKMIGDEYPYMLSVDGGVHELQKSTLRQCIYQDTSRVLDGVGRFYEAITTQLIEINSDPLYDKCFQLDVCRDVAQPSHTIFVANMWDIPFKGPKDMAIGVETDKLYLALSVAFAFVFLDLDAARSMALCVNAKQAVTDLSALMRVVCEAVHKGDRLHLSRFFELTRRSEFLAGFGSDLLRRVMAEEEKESGEVNYDKIVDMIIPTAAAAVATQSQHMTEMLNVLLSEPHYSKHWADIQRCATSDSSAGFDLLIGYALEANRLAPAAYGTLRKAAADFTFEKTDGTQVFLRKDDQLYLDFVTAGRDPDKFPDPDEINPTRDRSLYIHHGLGSHACLGKPITEIAMASQLKVFAKLRNLRRAPGREGQLKKTIPLPNPVSSDPRANPGSVAAFMKEDWSDWWPFPENLKLHHDGFEPDAVETPILEVPTGIPDQERLVRRSRSHSRSRSPHTINNGAADRAPSVTVSPPERSCPHLPRAPNGHLPETVYETTDDEQSSPVETSSGRSK